MYFNGNGVPADTLMATLFYMRATAGGNVNGRCNLGNHNNSVVADRVVSFHVS